jgi:hypothetical protein
LFFVGGMGFLWGGLGPPKMTVAVVVKCVRLNPSTYLICVRFYL